MWNYVKIFLISMVPVIELRGAMIYSQFLEMPIIPSYIVCIIGNMLPVPFVYLFERRLLNYGRDKKIVGPLCTFLLDKGEAAGARITAKTGRKAEFIALMLFVGIPLPGTGAWTGTLAASILNMGLKTTAAAVMLGVLLAGIIMMTAGVLGFGTL